MNRQQFLKTSSGLLAVTHACSKKVSAPLFQERGFDFVIYEPGKTLVPIT